MNKNEKKLCIKVSITKTLKFRVKVSELGKLSYEVTVGGESWKEGKGREYEKQIIERMTHIMEKLHNEFCASTPTTCSPFIPQG